MNLNPTLKRAISTLTTKWKHVGYVEAITWDEYVKREFDGQAETYSQFLEGRNIRMKNDGGIFSPKGDVIVVNYDFSNDELSEEDREKFFQDVSKLYDGLERQPKPLCDCDGSGNGLYYGLALFESLATRKDSTSFLNPSETRRTYDSQTCY